MIHLEMDRINIQFEFFAILNPEFGEVFLQFCSESLTWRF
jgi:hypothetical protein